MRGRNGRVTQRYHNSPHWKQSYGVRVTPCTGRERRILGDFEKVSELSLDTGWVEMRPAPGEDGWFSLARGDLCGGCHTCWGVDRGKRKCISLPYVETFNSKVIKGFVPELRSRYVFFEFRDSYVLCIYVMNVQCTFRIFLYMDIVQ